jgi:hypothetical protein
VAPVIDVFFTICDAPYSPPVVGRQMDLLKDLGFKRLYLVAANPGSPQLSNPWVSLMRPDNDSGQHALASVLALGDPNLAYLHEAKKRGFEVFAVYKPYEGGGGYTVPHGRRPFRPGPALRCVGGERCDFDTFLSVHPEMRVARRPIADYDRLVGQRIKRIEIAFCLDEVSQRSGPRSEETFPPTGDDPVRWPAPRAVRLWASPDNGKYEPYTGSLSVGTRIESRELRDANGFPLRPGNARCRVVEMRGLDIGPEVPYLAVTFDEKDDRRLLTIPQSMIKVFANAGEVPVTSTTYVRVKAVPVGEERPAAPDRWFDAKFPLSCTVENSGADLFAANGFEFEWHGSGFWGDGWKKSPCFGIARGKLQWMKGTHCEGYPEVRSFWVDFADRLFMMGYDGVDIRLQNHSGMVSDYAEFGFNDVLVEAYRAKHGVDILSEAPDPLDLMKVRGDFFLDFLRETAEVAHRRKKTLQVHLRDCYENPRLEADHGELGFWAMPKVCLDWRSVVDLVDEVTIKDYNFGSYNRASSSAIKSYASKRGKPVWVHCYINQGGDHNEDFVRAVEADDRVTGVLLYEMDCLRNPNQTTRGIMATDREGNVSFVEPDADVLRSLLGR